MLWVCVSGLPSPLCTIAHSSSFLRTPSPWNTPWRGHYRNGWVCWNHRALINSNPHISQGHQDWHWGCIIWVHHQDTVTQWWIHQQTGLSEKRKRRGHKKKGDLFDGQKVLVVKSEVSKAPPDDRCSEGLSGKEIRQKATVNGWSAWSSRARGLVTTHPTGAGCANLNH